MKADVRLSTRFLTTQNAHQVGVLVSLEGATPVRRPPINAALVLDRSGSMSGEPLAAARAAAERFAAFLSPADRLAVITFDNEVDLVSAPRPAGIPQRSPPSPGSRPAAPPTSPAAGFRVAGWWRRAWWKALSAWSS